MMLTTAKISQSFKPQSRKKKQEFFLCYDNGVGTPLPKQDKLYSLFPLTSGLELYVQELLKTASIPFTYPILCICAQIVQ